MHVQDIIKYGNLTLLRTLENVPQTEWETAGVCGYWSVKQILAHLASYEYMLVEVLGTFLEGGPTPHLDMIADPEANFNDDQVALRQHLSAQETLDDYETAHAEVVRLAQRIPARVFTQTGTIPWYGEGYDLEDFVVYTNYAHKREHCAEINHFRDTFES